MFVVYNNSSNNNWNKLEIIFEGDMYFLLTYQDAMVGDTCHISLQEAMKAAHIRFGINESDWTEISDDDSQKPASG